MAQANMAHERVSALCGHAAPPRFGAVKIRVREWLPPLEIAPPIFCRTRRGVLGPERRGVLGELPSIPKRGAPAPNAGRPTGRIGGTKSPHRGASGKSNHVAVT